MWVTDVGKPSVTNEEVGCFVGLSVTGLGFGCVAGPPMSGGIGTVGCTVGFPVTGLGVGSFVGLSVIATGLRVGCFVTGLGVA